MRWRLNIRPASFGVEQRIEALARATEMGFGLVMELHSSHTEFYADPLVALGEIAIYSPRTYKGGPEYVTTITDPEDDSWLEKAGIN